MNVDHNATMIHEIKCEMKLHQSWEGLRLSVHTRSGKSLFCSREIVGDHGVS